MFDRHRAEITVMQFTDHSLPVHQFVTAPWDFNPVSYCQPSSPTPMEYATSVSLEWHVWPGWRSIYYTCSLCCPTSWLFFNMSSKYATAKSRSLSIVSITCWKIAGATLTPNNRRLNLYSPRWVLIQRNLEHSSSTAIWRNASLR